ncbi:glycosyltransferase family 1 protein [Bacteriovorax sp. PP10]|uniref:Glycosyltransferase family 1 protein n=1 Tax=Bacteriovorax antarcticus TaxID=3088717 RepID=A0ABU5VS81_9BACT|nr:glycosyltransferase family 1 protein [Bacteriovorax sp. PP10]MEA9355918.1 glycosyltransferase family 1 protein [Bacteriovorax sp. PP10]
MRLGFDGKRATQNFRGLGNYSRGLIEGLLDYSQEEIFLYTPSVADERAQRWLKEHASPRLNIREPQSLLAQKIPSLWRSFSMVTDLKKDNLDLYHGLSHEIPVGLDGAKFKSVVTIHDLIFLRYPEFFPLIDRITYKKKFSYAGKNADMVIAICEQTKRDLIEFLGVDEKKIVVHYQSCDPVFYEMRDFSEQKALMAKYSFDRPFILNVGAFEERKNQLALIEAYAKITNQVEQDLVLIGNGKKYLESCKKKAEDLGLANRIHFLSNIPFNELPVFYQTADLFCFPSHFEGFGLPIVEALFSKTPVITSFGSCFPESAGPDSVYIDPLSVQDISDKMLKVLNDVSLQENMIARGFEFVQQFHRQNVNAKLLECYAKLF